MELGGVMTEIIRLGAKVNPLHARRLEAFVVKRGNDDHSTFLYQVEMWNFQALVETGSALIYEGCEQYDVKTSYRVLTTGQEKSINVRLPNHFKTNRKFSLVLSTESCSKIYRKWRNSARTKMVWSL